LKTDDQISIVFDENIPKTAGRKKSFDFLPHPKSASALPGKKRINKMWHFYPKQKHYLIKITQKTYFAHISTT